MEYAKLLNYLVQSASAGLTGWRKGGSDSAVPEGTF
jgi:hypothetical protein